jgi:hypothetical protein
MGWKVLQNVLDCYDVDGKERRLLAGVGAVHNWHSDEPWRGFFFHLHFTVLCLYYDKVSGGFGRNQMFLDPPHLLMLRELWRQKFEDRYGRTIAKTFDVHWHYSHGQGRLRHRLQYQFRRAVLDCYKATYRSGVPTSLNRDWAERLLYPPKNMKRLQWFGFLSDGVKAKFLKEKLSIALEKKAVRDKERRKVPCPDCGSQLFCYRHDIGYDELAKEGDSRVLAFPKRRRVGA